MREDWDDLTLEIVKRIDKIKVDLHIKATMKIATANFFYLLECLERDFKEQQTPKYSNVETPE